MKKKKKKKKMKKKKRKQQARISSNDVLNPGLYFSLSYILTSRWGNIWGQ